MAVGNIATLCLPVRLTGTVAAHRLVTPAGAQAGAGAGTLGGARHGRATRGLGPADSLGPVKVGAGAAVAVGATLKSDASGRAITWATSGAKVATALTAAAAAGDFIEAQLIPNG